MAVGRVLAVITGLAFSHCVPIIVNAEDLNRHSYKQLLFRILRDISPLNDSGNATSELFFLQALLQKLHLISRILVRTGAQKFV